MTPIPIFDDLEVLKSFTGPNMVKARPPKVSYPKKIEGGVLDDYRASLDFLTAYSASEETFKAYRREVDRFLIWLWNIKLMTLPQVTRHEAEAYLDFCKNPPMEWRSLEHARRFIEKGGLRVPNESWRPFVVKTPKAVRKAGKEPSLEDWAQSSASFRATLRILRTFFQHLVDRDHISKNAFAQLKSKYRSATSQQRQHIVRRLTYTQVKALFQALGAQSKELNDDQYERILFILSCMVGMYLRISEIAATGERQPTHGHFYRSIHEVDGQTTKSWWFSVLGKGNKQREIPVSDEVMEALARYRSHLGLPALPTGHETLPLFPKLRGSGGVTSTRHVRYLLQQVFDEAHQLLIDEGKVDEAQALQSCTVHWLRHTGISIDVMNRPMAHVRDSAGHSSLSVTGLYIDNDPLESYLTAKNTHLLPQFADEARLGVSSGGAKPPTTEEE